MTTPNTQPAQDAGETCQECATTKALLSDPTAVHINMLRGTIATPSKAQFLHVLGDQSLSTAEAERDQLKAECQRLREANTGLRTEMAEKLDLQWRAAKAVEAERDAYRDDAESAGNYVQTLGVLLGCMDGDDTPQQAIERLRARIGELNQALGFRVDAEHEIVLADAKLLLPEMVKARQRAQAAESELEWKRYEIADQPGFVVKVASKLKEVRAELASLRTQLATAQADTGRLAEVASSVSARCRHDATGDIHEETALEFIEVADLLDAALPAPPAPASEQPSPNWMLNAIMQPSPDNEQAKVLYLFKQRLEWLHAPGDVDAEGYEWGVFRVKWEYGRPVDVQQTLQDFSDLDAEMKKGQSNEA